MMTKTQRQCKHSFVSNKRSRWCIWCGAVKPLIIAGLLLLMGVGTAGAFVFIAPRAPIIMPHSAPPHMVPPTTPRRHEEPVTVPPTAGSDATSCMTIKKNKTDTKKDCVQW